MTNSICNPLPVWAHPSKAEYEDVAGRFVNLRRRSIIPLTGAILSMVAVLLSAILFSSLLLQL